MAAITPQNFSKIKEVATNWSSIRQYIRGGDNGDLVPVVIPRDRRGYGWLFMIVFAIYLLGVGLLGGAVMSGFAIFMAFITLAAAGLWLWRSSIVEIEQGTTGILARFGKFARSLNPGRHRLFWPWEKVAFIVDTSTEIPYTAPVLSSPTRENVPLKSIEFFLKFRIVDPVLFVRHIGASNFDVVLSSAVQDAIRRRSRQVETERAYDLRGSDVGDMQAYLNKQMQRYGVRIIGANIPDVQLTDQYQHDLATRETVAKELVAYEKEWELTRKQRTDTLLMEIERAKKVRDAKLIEVREAVNKAREDVAQMLQEQETAAEKIKLEIEADGRAKLKAAENEARALNHLGKSYRDNWAVLQYELARTRLQVGEKLVQAAPRPFLIHNESGGEQSALSTLLLAQLLPQMVGGKDGGSAIVPPPRASESDLNEMLDDLMVTAKRQMKKRRKDE